MLKTENLGLTIIPEQTHITFPLLNILMDIINTNFIILDSLSSTQDEPNKHDCPSLRINKELIEAMKLLQTDISTIQTELNSIEEFVKESDSTLEKYSKDLQNIQKTVESIPDTYVKKGESYDNISIDKITESIRQLKLSINKVIRNVNEILIYVSDHINNNQYYTRQEIDNKIKKFDSVYDRIKELDERCAILESNQNIMDLKINHIIKN